MSEPVTLQKDKKTVIALSPSQVKQYQDEGYEIIQLIEALNEVEELKPSPPLKRTRSKKPSND